MAADRIVEVGHHVCPFAQVSRELRNEKRLPLNWDEQRSMCADFG
jgi:hypothetical protein